MTSVIKSNNEMSIVEPTTSKWYTVKEICGACGVDLKTFTNFTKKITIGVDSIRYIMLGARHNVKTATYTESVLKQFQAWLLKNQANQGRSSSLVKQAVTNAVVTELEGKWYTVKEICEACGVHRNTFDNFLRNFRFTFDCETKTLSHNLKQYSESVLKQFQAWLLKNQTNQGHSSDMVKQVATNAVVTDLAITEIINSGNMGAMQCLMQHYMNETRLAAENKQKDQVIEDLTEKNEDLTEKNENLTETNDAMLECINHKYYSATEIKTKLKKEYNYQLKPLTQVEKEVPPDNTDNQNRDFIYLPVKVNEQTIQWKKYSDTYIQKIINYYNIK